MKIILLPGMDGTGDLFNFLLPALPADWRVEIISYPCDEFLTYAQMQEYVRERVPKDEPYILFAESMSSVLAVQFASTHPENLAGVILCVGFVSSPVSSWARKVPDRIARFFFTRPMPKQLCRFYLAGMDAPEELVDTVRRSTAKNTWQVMNGRRIEIVNCNARAALQKIAVPVMYLQASADRTVPARCGKEIVRLRPQTELVVIEGPHLLAQRAPQKVVEAIHDFLHRLA